MTKLLDIVFDGSTDVGTVLVDDIRMYFDDDGDAKNVFGLLNRQNDKLMILAREIERLSRDSEQLTLELIRAIPND
jgi:hypothetical protein